MAKPNYAFEKRQKELAKKKKKEEKRLRKAEEGHIEEEDATIATGVDTQSVTDSST
tara:strand:- start:1737 stop:1904 length:168 start_codon:yes stop_codon:yes gene_type:complete